MPITKGYRQRVDQAMAEVATCSVESVRQRLPVHPKLQPCARPQVPAPDTTMKHEKDHKR
jgi:hypothetical protein